MSYKKTWFRIKVFLKDKNKKPIPLIIREFFALWMHKKSFPIHYFGRFFYRKDHKDIYSIIDMKQYRQIVFSKKNNQDHYVHLLDNKLLFSMFCEQHGLSTPKLLGYNMGDRFFYEGKHRIFRFPQEIIEYFETIFKRSGVDRIFIKSFCGSGGKEVFLIDATHLGEKIEGMIDDLLRGAFIFQVGVTQHPEIAKVYSSSINTIRVGTFIDSTGEAHVLGCGIRFGTGGNVIDNVSSGGFYVPIDSATGVIGAKGIRAMIFGGDEFFMHPDTGVSFKGIKVPYFEEALKLCLKFANYIPNRLAGWDVAIQSEGPVVLEGNQTPGIFIGEVGYGGYVKHPLFKQMLEGDSEGTSMKN
ncbi:sugar-transfer associated ATP-grasp domain-containing protein [Pareuzebyella sediminis]|uniref:sugar-transfer associated ATP-grasp domain-containing protein n=1 Tax=Pareuzebyella sediminis TaxID=2607998 RepID=UPI0011EC2A57|nr:sugar-transfer associated ATP-grasp domain-containing protein [Pareuzebyella sediminis]